MKSQRSLPFKKIHVWWKNHDGVLIHKKENKPLKNGLNMTSFTYIIPKLVLINSYSTDDEAIIY